MRLSGLASGMDINQIVKDLMRAERMPVDKLFQQRERLSWQRDAMRENNIKLTEFRDSYSKMRLQGTFNAFKATSSNEAGLRATATGNAQAGNYQFEVHQLAKGANLTSESRIKMNNEQASNVTSTTRIFDAMGADRPEGNFQIELSSEVNGKTLTTQITVNSSDNFATLARKISQATASSDGKQVSLGLQASFDDALGRFFISSRETGEKQTFTISDVKDEGSNGVAFVDKYILGKEPGSGSHTATGQDAIIKFGGIDEEIRQATNNFTVRGINLHLIKDPGNTPEVYTVNVQSNPDQVFDTIKGFVDKYNELIELIQGKIEEPRFRSYLPLTTEQRQELSEREIDLWEEKAKSGLLRNDPALRSLLTNLRQAFSDPVSGIPSGEFRMLSEIGITTSSNWKSGGKLEINESRLRAAIAENPDQVMNLFTKTADEKDNRSQMGIGFRIFEEVNAGRSTLSKRAGTPGITEGDQSVLGLNIKSFNDRIARFEQRLVKIEERYWRQFTAMEKAMDQMNQQSMFLMQNFFAGFMGGN